MANGPTRNSSRRFSWTVNVPIIGAILLHSAVAIWVCATWKTTIESTLHILEARIGALETASANSGQLVERVKGVEVNVEVLKDQSRNIESKIDKLIDRGMK